ncbi:MAG: NADH-quinone oxidoreductase subunit N, partial [Dermabacter sp.]|nr:NADH-quinone oxidoreductase subunit N [Dermabacter sp.]
MNSVATAVNFTVPEISWAALAPVLCVLCGGILAVLAESFVPVRARRASVFGIAVVALIASAVALVMRWAAVLGSPQSLGEYIEDPLTVAAQGILVLIAFFAVLVIADRSEAGDGAFAGQPSDRPGSSDEERSDSKGY